DSMSSAVAAKNCATATGGGAASGAAPWGGGGGGAAVSSCPANRSGARGPPAPGAAPSTSKAAEPKTGKGSLSKTYSSWSPGVKKVTPSEKTAAPPSSHRNVYGAGSTAAGSVLQKATWPSYSGTGQPRRFRAYTYRSNGAPAATVPKGG